MSKHNELFIPLKDGFILGMTDNYDILTDEDEVNECFTEIYINIFNNGTKEIETFKMSFADYYGFNVTGLDTLKLILNNTQSNLVRNEKYGLYANEDMTIDEFKEWIENMLYDSMWNQDEVE
ncbi:hypothetical protein [Metaclostridioides mangenotii]|uniref:hypothetical protein n=1 Tax=Metaclostridioides mangenotii TaxID=1540 RepID=UPI0004651B6E|nr:hypothetical protein [Clostridioides mangenotii]